MTRAYRTLFIASFFACASVANAESTLNVPDLRLFSEAVERIRTNYIEVPDDKALIAQCIRGMASGLDSDSEYVDEDEMRLVRGGDTQSAAIGIELARDGASIKVVAPIDDTPAAQAGIKSGDIILRIDGRDLHGVRLRDAIGMLRGDEGSAVVLTLARVDAPTPRTVTVTRRIVKFESVKHRLIAGGIGYIRITTFDNSAASSLQTAIDKLVAANGAALTGLMLDLRNNPGGLLNQAVAVADAFLTDGLIVYTRGRASETNMKLAATPADRLNGAPMVVLVNRGSAAGSEILAGALQDHARATVVGERTFGRASIQTILPLQNGGAIRLTTARWYTPKGRAIHRTGIAPDVDIADTNGRDPKRTDPQFEHGLSILKGLVKSQRNG